MPRFWGIIAEGTSDVDVIKACIAKLVDAPNHKVAAMYDNGCNTLERKCASWAKILLTKGCNALIIVRDKDTKSEKEIKETIAGALNPCPFEYRVIVVPVHAIEAWLLADEEAIRRVFNIKKPIKPIPNPEAELKPDKMLERLVERLSKNKRYYLNTDHNGKIATHARLAKLKRCSSFIPLEEFVKRVSVA